MRCPTAGRYQWRHSLLQSVADFCVMQFTFPVIARGLDGFLAWIVVLATCSRHELESAPYPPHLHGLIATQSRIGWRQLFNGRFSYLWSEIQDAYYYRERATVPTKQKSGLKWQTGLINLLWDKWYELWKMRNEDVHGKDMATKATAEKREVKRRLMEIYALKNKMEPSARALLCADIRIHLEQPTWVIKNWLSMYGGSFFNASAKKVTACYPRRPIHPEFFLCNIRYPPGSLWSLDAPNPGYK